MADTHEVGASDLHPPIIHTGPSCAWCKNEAGLTEQEAQAVDAFLHWQELPPVTPPEVQK